MPRKHLIALGINKKQQTQAKLWMKLAKEIKVAAKIGGTNVDSNSRLKRAIDKALANNLSKESIDKNIFGANKDSELLQDLEYELFAENGLQLIVEAVSNNTNRTISAIRGYAAKLNANIAKQNSVKTNFKLRGEFLIPNDNDMSLDYILEKLIDSPIEDIINNDDCYQVLVLSKDFNAVKKIIDDVPIKLIDSGIRYVASTYVDISKEQFLKLEKFLESCNNDEDIQNVVTNLGDII
ncbi:MAG: YebC/PmpR family DNA-binding transcriptional regulator [Malacoplasma sp.]